MTLSNQFWDLYARVYEALEDLLPYRGLVDDLTHSVSSAAKGPILDAGCGTGSLCAKLEERFPQAQVVGIDVSEEMLKRATTKCPNLRTICCDLSRPLPFGDQAFEGLVCSNVLHTLDNPDSTLRELRRVLRPGGQLAVACPAPGFSMKALVKAHLRGGPQAWLSLVPLTIPLVLAAIFSLILMRVGRPPTLLDEVGWHSALQKAGFTVLDIRRTYGGQDLLLQASA